MLDTNDAGDEDCKAESDLITGFTTFFRGLTDQIAQFESALAETAESLII